MSAILASRRRRRPAASLDETDHHPSEPAAGSTPALPGRRPWRRAGLIAVAAISLSSGAAALQLTGDATADGPPPIDCRLPDPSDESDAACDGLWGRVRALGLPEDRWASAAASMGLLLRGEWISDDGLRWEHLDGTTYVVAAPRSSDEQSPSAS